MDESSPGHLTKLRSDVVPDDSWNAKLNEPKSAMFSYGLAENNEEDGQFL